MITISAKEYNEKYKTNFKTNKFNAKRCMVGGKSFMSTSEGALYQELLIQKQAGLIKEVICQAKEPLMGQNGDVIGNYYVDFKLIHNDGKIEFLEHKGQSTDLWKWKWKMLLDKYKKEIQKGNVICNINWYKPKYNYFKKKKSVL